MVEKADFKTKTHICMPVISIVELMVLALSVKKKTTIVYYNILPRYLRGVSRIFKIPQGKIVNAISSISPIPIQKVKHGDYIQEYPYLHLHAMETVTKITEQFACEEEGKILSSSLEKLIGSKPSMAYIRKYISYYQLHEYVPSILACYHSLPSRGNYIVIGNPEWPASLNNIIQRCLEPVKFEFIKPRCRYFFIKVIRSLGLRITVCLGLIASTLFYVFKRGITVTTISKKCFKLIAEFYDPKRLNKTPYDADYWIDNANVKSENILFFLTNKQMKRLLKEGYILEDIVKLFKDKGYNLAILDKLSYTLPVLKELTILLVQLIAANLFRVSSPLIMCRISLKAWTEYMEYVTLFLHYSSKDLIYLTVPNGIGATRFDDAIMTGLCRKYSIRSVDCQTRGIYSGMFDVYFNCCDLYLSWGPAWHKMLPGRMRFVERVVEVGNIYLDSLLPLHKKNIRKVTSSRRGKHFKIIIFNTDMSHDHHCSTRYNMNMLINCAKLAKAYPEHKFVVKVKVPKDVDKIMANKEFYQLYSTVKSNFIFAKPLKHEYAHLIASSDIIIAIGFTTPGSEGLLLGKRSIYYSELKCGGQPYNSIPNLIAKNEEELKKLFDMAINDYKDYPNMISDSLDALDPFRDGHSLDRIHKTLMED